MTSPQNVLTKILTVFTGLIKVYTYFKMDLSGILYLNSERSLKINIMFVLSKYKPNTTKTKKKVEICVSLRTKSPYSLRKRRGC